MVKRAQKRLENRQNGLQIDENGVAIGSFSTKMFTVVDDFVGVVG
jgi:hypothetical protein